MDMGWQRVPAGSFTKQQVTIPTITAKEAGFIFVYLSYEDVSNNYVYFDDFKVTVTPTNILQSNEYYAHGSMTANSWTRDNATQNNFLANGGTELNTTSSLYDLEFRNFDPILGRMHQVDPMADNYARHTPYNYAFSNPITFNDPNGADPLVVRRGATYTIDWNAAGDYGGSWQAGDGAWSSFGSDAEAISWGTANQAQQAAGGGQIVATTTQGKGS